MKLKWHSVFFVGTTFLFLSFAPSIQADPPTRIARLCYLKGSVSFLSKSLHEWVEAQQNWPLTIGDSLYLDKNAEIELQFGNSAINGRGGAQISILNLDSKIVQMQVMEGKFFLRIKKITLNQEYEIDTPNLAFVTKKAGLYRIDVDPLTKTTKVTIHEGEANIYGDNNAHVLKANQSYRYSSNDLNEYQRLEYAKDDFDTVGQNREPKKSAFNYVPSAVIGSEDLDNHGKWVNIEMYGNVWTPNKVSNDWAPYHYGHWAWIPPWGWTWIDDAIWGFAPFHYGRWIYYNEHWYWLPGKPEKEPVYAPALVMFVNINANIAWFPLAFNEFYWPPYPTSSDYFMNLNNNDTRMSLSQMMSFYSKRNKTQKYLNFEAPNAMIALSKSAFMNSEAVTNQPQQKVLRTKTFRGRILTALSIPPTQKSLVGNAKLTSIKLITLSTETMIIAKNTPPIEAMSAQITANTRLITKATTKRNMPKIILVKPIAAKVPPKIAPGRKPKDVSKKTEEAPSNAQKKPITPAVNREERKRKRVLREQKNAPIPFEDKFIHIKKEDLPEQTTPTESIKQMLKAHQIKEERKQHPLEQLPEKANESDAFKQSNF